MENTVSLYEVSDFLIENASYDLPMSTQEISKHFAFRTGADAGEVLNDVEKLLEENLDKPLLLGSAIRKKEGGWYIDLPLSETDIAVLKTMLISLPYCEKWQTTELAKRLDSFLPEYMRDSGNVVYINTAGKYNGTFYENMTQILKALYPVSGEVRKISFEYCEYNEKLELEPRVSRMDGSVIRMADPLKVVCVNNFFYLVTFYLKGDEVGFINYRIDRMKNVKCTDISAQRFEEHLSEQRKYILELKRSMDKGRRVAKAENRIYQEPIDDITALDEAHRIDNNGFNLGEYIHRSKIMYTDKMVDRVKAKLDRRALNGVIDLFGFDIDAEPIDDEHLIIYIHNVTETTVVKWALQFCEAVEILEPPEIKEALSKKTALLFERYRQGAEDDE